MKYELTDNTKIVYGRKLHQIRALKDFKTVTGKVVKAGDLGGWIEKESNLSQNGSCWVFDNAEVFGSAKVFDNAEVFGSAKVWGNAKVCGNAYIAKPTDIFVIGPAGSRNDFTTFYKNKDNGVSVKCGCFNGDVDSFLAKVSETHSGNKHAEVYRKAVEMAKIQILS